MNNSLNRQEMGPDPAYKLECSGLKFTNHYDLEVYFGSEKVDQGSISISKSPYFIDDAVIRAPTTGETLRGYFGEAMLWVPGGNILNDIVIGATGVNFAGEIVSPGVRQNAYSTAFMETALLCTFLPRAGALEEISLIAQAPQGSSKAKTVWDSIKATQPVYEGTQIPKSFEMVVGNQKFWVHPNASEHMFEYVTRRLTHSININSQEIMTSFQGAVNKAVMQGIKYEERITIGNWEFIFSAPRGEGLLPVIKHAQYIP